ncbi:MAG: glycosyltransferase [Candidatus Pacearchaeota archaeon]|nr:glycosyltransferase [Candidatus Pacearchaeota archaeon]
MENKKNLLVTLADKNYTEQAKQLFSSVYWNAGWKGDYMLLAHEIPEKDLKWFRDKGVLVKKCKPLYDKNINGYSPVVLDKFYLFTPEFKKWKNIIYLDADIIVRANLDELTKVKGFASPKVLEKNQILNGYLIEDSDMYEEKKELKKTYNLRKSAFNSGVMAFSTDIINEKMFDKLYESFCINKRIISGEDPLINLMFYRKWKKISIAYDILPRAIVQYLHIKPEKIEGIILHFISKGEKEKPWHKENYFYSEWKSNIERADLIDLTKIPMGKIWRDSQICSYSFFLKINFFLYPIKPFLAHLLISIKQLSDRLVGQIGIIIKYIKPELYNKIKRIINGYEK